MARRNASTGAPGPAGCPQYTRAGANYASEINSLAKTAQSIHVKGDGCDQRKIRNTASPASIEPKPTNRICPSVMSVTRRNASRHTRGATKGNTPSMTSIKASAATSVSPTSHDPFAIREAYFCGLLFFRYPKNSELGSRTKMSLLFLKLCRMLQDCGKTHRTPGSARTRGHRSPRPWHRLRPSGAGHRGRPGR